MSRSKHRAQREYRIAIFDQREELERTRIGSAQTDPVNVMAAHDGSSASPAKHSPQATGVKTVKNGHLDTRPAPAPARSHARHECNYCDFPGATDPTPSNQQPQFIIGDNSLTWVDRPWSATNVAASPPIPRSPVTRKP